MLTDREKQADRKKAAESAPLTDWQPLLRSPGGIDHFWRETEDGAEIKTVQDVGPILEHAKRLRNENAGWSPSKELRRGFLLPLTLVEKWKREEGVNALDSAFNPDVAKWLLKKLSDPDYAYLRTADGRLGISNGVIR